MIYRASFKNPADDSYDTIDMNKVEMILLEPIVLKSISANKDISITYGISFSEEEGNNLVCITGSMNESESKFKTNLDPQDFTNEMSKLIQERRLPESSDIIMSAKEDVNNQFKAELLEKGNLLKDLDYEAFGYIFSLGDKIGTFETVKINNNNNITLGHNLSIVELDNAKDLEIEFILAGRKYNLSCKHVVKDVLSYEEFNSYETDESYEVKSMGDYSSYEDMYEDRRKLISSVSSNSNTNIDEFSFLI